MWTSGRYSDAVVRSMVAALEELLGEREDRRLSLLGYSGGGALAMLMADRLGGVEQVVTLAANLDIDAWADLHGYSRLLGSLNPAEQAALPSGIRRLHLAGELDKKVPANLIKKAVSRDPLAEVRVLPGFGHRCCWVEHWPEILARLDLRPMRP
jgi:pimeloyl-ACP methyl ester carboxylesterase